MKKNIVLHCGGMPFNGDTIATASLGGSETAAYYVAKELAAQGHRVTLFTNHQSDSSKDGVNYCFAGEASEQHPLGDRFDHYAMNTPHDVLIIQRNPSAFSRPYAAKLTYWWLHDLGMYRMKQHVQAHLWNITRTLCVSEYHKNQLHSVYDIPLDALAVLPNGVDSELFEESVRPEPDGKRHLLYSSRPERGLENLVRPGGIMEQLGDKYVLHVCGYDNTTEQMRPYYEALWNRIEQLPNAVNHGSLSKKELAVLQQAAHAWVYPTEFEEVFCITAAECMMAGTHIVTTDAGCLAETLWDYPAKIVPLTNRKFDQDHVDEFVKAIKALPGESAPIPNKRWSTKSACTKLLSIIDEDFAKATANPNTVARHLINVSDIAAIVQSPALLESVKDEIEECYGFYLNDDFEEHYRRYYAYEAARGVNYGPESLDGNDRFEVVSDKLTNLETGSVVLDYGCAHGHYTINLAKRYPALHFVGIDLAQSNVDKAKAWAKEEDIHNVEFRKTDNDLSALADDDYFKAIIAAEVLEHVAHPQELADRLTDRLAEDGVMIITTPYGPWEAIGYKEHWPYRAHIHHFERRDLEESFGHHPGFALTVVPSGRDLGSFVTTYGKPLLRSRVIDYERKLTQLSPRQTLSACVIVKDGTANVKQMLNSIKDIVDEVVVGVDRTTTDGTREMISDWCMKHHIDLNMFDMDSPLKTGFDYARNLTIRAAKCDWVLWLDSDEVLHHSKNVLKYLKPNQYDGYAIKQHHVAVQPLGNLKTDLPCRLFRNGKDIQFFGVVHEHPEKGLNEGLGPVTLISDLDIMHTGYATEEIRRKRFERNIDLMRRDREKYPDRLLGKFLWIRDLSLLCQYEIEHNGGHVTQRMIDQAQEAVHLWEELLNNKEHRLVLDSLEFYSKCVRILGGGFDLAMAVDTSKLNGGLNPDRATNLQGHFRTREHADKLMKSVVDSKMDHYDSRYF